MNYIDFAIAVAIFLFFFAIVLTLSTNYFSNISGLTKTSEFRSVAEGLFKLIFGSKGIPENWEETPDVNPVQLGLMEDLYRIPILVKETDGYNRTNEPVSTHIIFDYECQNKSWNTTLRVFDQNNNEIISEISNTTFCTNQFLNQSDVAWEVNISANQTKKFWIYYSPDDEITDPNYPSLSYNTSSWIPSDRDSWTEGTTDWSRYEGSTGTPTFDTTNKIRGTGSVNITGNFDSSSLGLEYNPSNNITGVSNGWYLDAWLYVDDTTSLSNVNVLINDNNESIYVDVLSDISSGAWYHFEKELASTAGWTGWSSFNASNGIDFIDFYMVNVSSGLTRTLKIDGLHFKKKPLEVKTFPEKRINALSSNKFNALKNISYDELRKTVGDYKFRIAVDGDTYGWNMNESANVECYESPRISENRNGTIEKIIAKVCVWK